MIVTSSRSLKKLPNHKKTIWRIVQTAVWLVGLAILLSLVFFPDLGIHLFWNILIPVAPALIVVAIGLWRNICPMATNSLFIRHQGLSKRKKLSMSQSAKLNFVAVVALFLIVPLRHGIFDMNGMATAILILSLSAVAIFMGLRYEWKSGWCSGLCPVHPVEKLYGLNSNLEISNAHCDSCSRCMVLCPDSTPTVNPMSLKKTPYHKMAGFLMVAAFPGFVWGWFQVPDSASIESAAHLLSLYQLPAIGMAVSSLLYFVLKPFLKESTLISVFSAAAVSCYYWFRIPALVGYGIYPGDGMLIDLNAVLPLWVVQILILSTTAFFFWWIVLRTQKRTRWAKRPIYADHLKSA